MNEHDICRNVYNATMVDVRKQFTRDQIKSSWAWGDHRGRNSTFEFHGPDNYYTVCSRACCLWSARTEGWNKLMESKNI